jgi:putative endonuclease
MPAENRYCVYVMTNWNNRVMYVGVTNDLERRLYEHKNKLIKGFTEKYNVNKLVYFEETADVLCAIAREKEIKRWRREKKDALVQSTNPEWRDLSEERKDFSRRSK